MMKPKNVFQITYFLFLVTMITVILTVISYGQVHTIEGIYYNNDDKKRLEVKPNGTFSLTYSDKFLNNVTTWYLKNLGFGTWKKEGDFLVFNSPDDIKSNVLDIFVEEKVINSDSLTFEIHSPYEKKWGSDQLRLFKYEILLASPQANVGDLYEMNESAKSFLLEKGFKINGIILSIVPDPYYYPNKLTFNYLKGQYYIVKNPNANYFKINIPDFTLEYIGYMRFKNEYIKIIDDRTLLLRGEKFSATE